MPVWEAGPPRGGQLAGAQRLAPPSGSSGRPELSLQGGRPCVRACGELEQPIRLLVESESAEGSIPTTFF